MKSWNKIVAALLAVILAAGLLAGCGSNATEASTEAPAAEPAVEEAAEPVEEEPAAEPEESPEVVEAAVTNVIGDGVNLSDPDYDFQAEYFFDDYNTQSNADTDRQDGIDTFEDKDIVFKSLYFDELTYLLEQEGQLPDPAGRLLVPQHPRRHQLCQRLCQGIRH